ncbi:MAG: cytochrome C biogenesis protein ResB [Gammaproteobacteria bacterium]|nr:MAG: cytochrome C biogenesis protein ResB [Gammaproteobacteria bacterium]
MSEKSTSSRSNQTFGRRLFLFLGTMDLAITLLLVLAVASVIGTVLQQNQPYTDYMIKFGPFWFELFEQAGLYDVYSSLWFLAILVLLVISTSICVTRNTPRMLQDMLSFRSQIQEKSLRAMQHSKQWTVNNSIENSLDDAETELKKQGFRVRRKEKDNQVIISSMRGGMNRLGYIFTHLAIIVICIGGLFDSNLYLKLAEWQGKIKIETRNLATADVPDISRLAVGKQAFRGSIHIPEGRSSDHVFIAVRDGYLVQKLPFRVEVKDFRIEHYPTGQPKSFESDLVVYDDDLAQPLETTISVNHPLIYKGYAIYQASFSDGGTGLELQVWPLSYQTESAEVDVSIDVFERRKMQWGKSSLQLEITSFRPFNINPDPTEDDPNNLRDFGPSFGYKLRSETGEASEYINYMLPVPRKGREFYLSGVRSSPAEEFGYLYLPIGEEGDLSEFNAFLATLRDSEQVNAVARTMMLETLSTVADGRNEKLEQVLQDTLVMLIKMFTEGGFTVVTQFIETTLPEAEKEALGPAYLGMLRQMLARLYFNSLEGVDTSTVSDEQLLFLQDAVDAIGSFSRYGAPVYLSLSNYNHIQASGLQIAQSPGKSTVYFGCALLIIGVFLLFYVPQRRLWLCFSKKGDTVELILAGMSNRDPREFEQFFETMFQQLKLTIGQRHSK